MRYWKKYYATYCFCICSMACHILSIFMYNSLHILSKREKIIPLHTFFNSLFLVIFRIICYLKKNFRSCTNLSRFDDSYKMHLNSFNAFSLLSFPKNVHHPRGHNSNKLFRTTTTAMNIIFAEVLVTFDIHFSKIYMQGRRSVTSLTILIFRYILRAQSFTSLKADFRQDINRGFAFSRCL